jgi:hypothetical protein
MKGIWTHDTQADVWHVIWNRNHPQPEGMENPLATTWCGKVMPLDAPEKPGEQINWADVVHDECARKSEEL